MGRKTQQDSTTTVFDGQTRNSRQKRAGLVGMRVNKVELRARAQMRRKYAQRGLFTGVAAFLDCVTQDLLRRANGYRAEGKVLTALHIAKAMQEADCMAAYYLRCRRIGGITLHRRA